MSSPHTPLLPFPCSQSDKHQPPAYCDPHTNITAINEKTGASYCKEPWEFLVFSSDLAMSVIFMEMRLILVEQTLQVNCFYYWIYNYLLGVNLL